MSKCDWDELIHYFAVPTMQLPPGRVDREIKLLARAGLRSSTWPSCPALLRASELRKQREKSP